MNSVKMYTKPGSASKMLESDGAEIYDIGHLDKGMMIEFCNPVIFFICAQILRYRKT